MKLNLRNRLLLGTVMLLTLQLLFVGLVVSTLNQNNKAMEEILQQRYAVINNINSIRYELNNISLCLHKASAGGHDPLEQVRNVNDSILHINSMLQRLETYDNTPAALDILARFNTAYYDYRDVVRQTVSYIEQGQSQTLVNRLSDVEETLYNSLAVTVVEFRTVQEQLMIEALDRSQASFARMMRMLVLFFIIYLFLCIGIVTWVLRSMIRNISKLTTVISSAADKSSDMPRLDIDSHDELGTIAEAYNRMATGIENFARKERETALLMQQRTWLSTNIAELTTSFQDAPNTEELGSFFIGKVCSLIAAPYGVIYLRQDDEVFTQLAAYAADTSVDTPQSIHIGEGLIGQCAKEKQKIVIDQTPENYIKINSGLGSAAPVALTIFPVEFGDQVLAVVEIASFKPCSDLHHELLDKAASNLGIFLFGFMQQIQIKQLLNESQLLNEELRVQAEELQSQSEELQSQHEEMKTINEQLEAQNLKVEQRRMEMEAMRNELQEKNDQLIQASEFKSQFLANISHELRTPLNSILILAEILAQNPDENLTSKQVEFVTTIYNSGRDLLNLINQVLDLTKIEAGKMDIHYTEIILSEWIDAIKSHHLLEASRRGIDFAVEIDPELPDIIYNDEQHLSHIINNLLSNAFKFSPHGRVKLSLNRSQRSFSDQYPALQKADWAMEIVVRDNGIGIPADKQELIFEAFMQADGATNRIYGGSGLGLSICRQTAWLLGGYIEVDSQSGQGSTFRVFVPCDAGLLEDQVASSTDIQELPLQVQTHAPLDYSPKELSTPSDGVDESPFQGSETIPMNLKDKTILLVDDDMRNIFALTSVLENKQIGVLFAENGKEAIQVLLEHPEIDLIIMDIMMPEMDGYEAIKNIRAMPEYRELPIIALTAKAMKGDRLKCIEVGASDYMNKPVEIEQLLSLISVWMYK